MSESSHICNPSLFLKVPDSSLEITFDDFRNEIDNSTDFGSLVDKTYSLLTSQELTLVEALNVWEIRLTLHLFNNQLSYAKKEAINLNNALYLQENPNPTPLPGGNRSRTNSTGSATPPLQPIYPLPKGKNISIEYDMLVLLLRLKSIPNMNLINELYKLNYQMRLKPETDEGVLRMKLINLSYDIIVILTITKSYTTLLNYLNGIRSELERVEARSQPSSSPHAYTTYLSNIILVQIIIEAFVYKQKGSTSLERKITKKYAQLFEQITEDTKRSLVYVVQNISASISENKTTEYHKTTLELADLIGLIVSDKLSVRILCSMLGLWDLSNNYGFKLHGETTIEFESAEATSHQQNQVTRSWCKYINKVYGLE